MLSLVAQHGVLDRLNRNQVLTDLVASQVYLTKGSSTKHTANSIEVARALLDSPIKFEVINDLLLQLLYVAVELL